MIDDLIIDVTIETSMHRFIIDSMNNESIDVIGASMDASMPR